MRSITFDEARKKLGRLIEQVVEDAEPIIVCMDTDRQVVLLPLDEFNSWQETLYLLSTPANAAHLQRSLREAELGQTVKRSIPEDDDYLHRVSVGRLPLVPRKQPKVAETYQ